MVIIMYYGRSSKHNGGGANSRGGSNASHNDSGRAFEYACMAAVYQLLRGYRDKSLIAHKPSMGLNMAKHAWGDIDRTMQAKLTRAAYSMTEQLLEYEPRLSEGSDVVSLRLQDDDAGEAGDVRDIVISRSDINWEIGLSVKHNHFAVKHSRLSPTIDFGKKWYKLPCSAEYWRAVKPIFDYLAEAQSKGQRCRSCRARRTTYTYLCSRRSWTSCGGRIRLTRPSRGGWSNICSANTISTR